MTNVMTTNHLDELDVVAQRLLHEGRNAPVWLFFGDMGAGKTTLIKAICRALGVVSVVQSPTFGLVNEYATADGQPVYHFDCYRLNNEREALDVGIEEYFDTGHHCFVEWPERIKAIWPSDAFCITLSVNSLSANSEQRTVNSYFL